MKTIIFDKELTLQSVQWLCDEIDKNITTHEKIDIYFAPYKEDFYAEEILVHYLDRKSNMSGDALELIAFGELGDFAFNVFFRCDVNKTILKTASADINPKQYGYLKWIKKIEWNKEILKNLEAGENIKLNSDQLIEILLKYGQVLKDINKIPEDD